MPLFAALFRDHITLYRRAAGAAPGSPLFPWHTLRKASRPALLPVCAHEYALWGTEQQQHGRMVAAVAK